METDPQPEETDAGAPPAAAPAPDPSAPGGQAEEAAPAGQGGKFLLDFAPLLGFWIARQIWDIYVGTAVLIVGVLLATAWTWKKERRISPMGMFVLFAVLIFGGLTLILQNDTFLKVKVTVANGLLGTALLIGLVTKRSLLKLMLGQAVQLTDRGWNLLTIRYALFFFATGALNEFIWRNYSEDVWANFKVFGLMALTLIFTGLQIPLFTRYMIEDEEPEVSA